MKNSKVELQLPDCNRVYELGEAKSDCVSSGITNAAQQRRIFRSAGGHKPNVTDMEWQTIITWFE